MPMAPKRHQLVGKTARQEYDQRRGSASERGYDSRWLKYKDIARKKMVVADADPYCRYCREREAETLDHAIPPTRLYDNGSAEYDSLFWNEQLHVPCCMRCNSEKQDRMPHELTDLMRQRLLAVMAKRGIDLQQYTR